MKPNLKKLTAQFIAAGATDPEGWARSEINEDIPQLARFLFLRGAWKMILGDTDTTWIDAYRKPARKPDDPYAGVAPALERLLAQGIARQDLTDVVRAMQAELLFGICYFLEDPSGATDDLTDDAARDELEKVAWGLYEVDDSDKVGRHLGGLHESVLQADPTGREMRPRK